MWTIALGFSIIDKLTSVIVNSETASSSLCPHAPTWASELKYFDSQRGFPFSRVTCEMLFCAQEETKPRQNTAESKQNQAPIVFRLLTKYPGVQTFPFKGRKPLEQWGGLWKSQSTEDAFPPRARKQNFKLIFKKKIKFTNLIMTLWGGNAAVIFLWPRNSCLLFRGPLSGIKGVKRVMWPNVQIFPRIHHRRSGLTSMCYHQWWTENKLILPHS